MISNKGRKSIVDAIINNVMDNYIEGGKEGLDHLEEWMQAIKNLIYQMIDDPTVALEITMDYPEELKELGIEMGEIYNFADYKYEKLGEVMTHIYVLMIYAKAVDPDNPEWELYYDGDTFGILEHHAQT